ncbi:hypothetical protein SAMN05421820_103158 [Pedobacter steynii]|uniref:Uncharacterized protein n=1 Tax=Pedobacter steynii TaxID=430522 RepID=A0A1G9R800_9SPHI|nr:hypothetical protein SAMN05421820_103158 [Pedobacter steynii]
MKPWTRLLTLVEEVVARLKPHYNSPQEDKWISYIEAMYCLIIKSKTILQTYRDEGKIRFSEPSRKSILYDRDSINEFLNKYTSALSDHLPKVESEAPCIEGLQLGVKQYALETGARVPLCLDENRQTGTSP